MEFLLAGVAVDALGDADDRHLVDAEFLQRSTGRRNLTRAAVDQHQVRPGVRLPVGVFLRQPPEAPGQHLAHHPEVVAGGQIRPADVELAVLRLDEALGPRDHHRADRVRPHDVAVVIDLDPLGRPVEPEGLPQPLQQRRLAGALGHAPGQRLAGVARGLLDQPRLLAPQRLGDRHLAPELGGERVHQQVGVVRHVAGQDQSRRGLVAVELPDEGLEDLARLRPRPGAREVGAVAPVLMRADEEHLHAGVAALLVQCNNIRLLDGLGVDPLAGLNRRQRPDAVAQSGRPLELHSRTRRAHRAGQILLHAGRTAAEEQYRVLHQHRVVGLRDQPHAGRAAPLDLVQEARAGAAFEHAVRAAAQQERLLQLVQRAVHAPRRSEGSEVTPLVAAQPAVLADLREGMVAGDQDVGEALVVAEQHVVLRLELLDEVLLQQKRLGFRLRGQEHHRGRRRDHSTYARAVPGRLGIARDPLSQAPGLADVEYLAAGIEHPVDARAILQPPEIVADDRMPDASSGL